MAIAKGSVVYLKTGGAPKVVEALSTNSDMVKCIWDLNNKKFSEWYDLAVLTETNPMPPISTRRTTAIFNKGY